MGFGFDYKFGPRLKLTPDFIFSYNRSQSQYKIKFKVFVYKPQYYSNMDGLSVNLVLGIGGLLQYFDFAN